MEASSSGGEDSSGTFWEETMMRLKNSSWIDLPDRQQTYSQGWFFFGRMLGMGKFVGWVGEPNQMLPKNQWTSGHCFCSLTQNKLTSYISQLITPELRASALLHHSSEAFIAPHVLQSSQSVLSSAHFHLLPIQQHSHCIYSWHPVGLYAIPDERSTLDHWGRQTGCVLTHWGLLKLKLPNEVPHIRHHRAIQQNSERSSSLLGPLVVS